MPMQPSCLKTRMQGSAVPPVARSKPSSMRSRTSVVGEVVPAAFLVIFFDFLGSGAWICQLGAWNCLLGAWICLLGAWISFLGAWTSFLGAWTSFLGAWTSFAFGCFCFGLPFWLLLGAAQTLSRWYCTNGVPL